MQFSALKFSEERSKVANLEYKFGSRERGKTMSRRERPKAERSYWLNG